ncbi:MAG: hypothetical protein GON13_01255 [Nanoarchaeota archaeon]|nr:hypothetical protein [Nanoarchaeota archaeon]
MTLSKKIQVEGMHCNSCKKIIEQAVNELDGIQNINIDYVTQKGTVKYDEQKTSFKKIITKIEQAGYTACEQNNEEKQGFRINTKTLKTSTLLLGLLFILFGGYTLANNFFQLPELTQSTSIMLLFLTGLLTGFHCIGMCGGFIMSYNNADKKNHLKYGIGKTISYTIIGALFGLIGSIIVFTPALRGMAAILAGGFLIIFGLNTLNIFPSLRRIRIPLPKVLKKINSQAVKTRSPFVIGLLNGLMIACGPLQAMYVFAAGTGSVIQGALSLFAFGIGTLPVLLGFGYFTSYISKNSTHRILKASGVVVLVLGVIMINRGLALTGVGLDLNSITASMNSNTLTGLATFNEDYQEIRMNVTRYGWEPDSFVLKKGIPVKWIINGISINGCNNAIQVPKLGLNFDINKGEQIIEFTPENEGVIPWSCWMGMIPGTFLVKEEIGNEQEMQQELSKIPVQTSSSCGGSCGSSTCGAATGGSCGCGI